MTDLASPDWDLISSYGGLLALALISIYAGAHGSLSPVKPHRSPEAAATTDDEDEEEEIEDRLSSSDAWFFPVIGSVILFGLYIVVKYIGKEWINWLLQWYFTVAGVGSVGKSLISLTRWTLGTTWWKHFDRHRFVYLKHKQEILSFSWRTPSIFLIPLGALPSILYTFGTNITRRSALLTDILALSFSHNALSLLKLDSFKTGCILLSGLFVYDIWWVFGTEVMVKVATNLDVPIKLLWTKSLTFNTERGFTMLGLGDVVIPGLFVSLALRYDHHRSSQKSTDGKFDKPYFFAALLGYTVGLGTTMFVMHTFKAAQPALLYLSPACILSFLLTAVARGELQDAWTWSDEPQSPNTTESHEPVKNGDAKAASETAEMNGNRLTASDTLAGPEKDSQLSDAGSQGEGHEKKRRTRKKKIQQS
ncbi:unnamed protein product [Somion occarium]|uniref:Signal peptide peptidase n=1 Tax=Somion occarium TaxID=3059160 RepID=A0ABP1DGZ0_9APHY